jgi:hypothetical protein
MAPNPFSSLGTRTVRFSRDQAPRWAWPNLCFSPRRFTLLTQIRLEPPIQYTIWKNSEIVLRCNAISGSCHVMLMLCHAMLCHVNRTPGTLWYHMNSNAPPPGHAIWGEWYYCLGCKRSNVPRHILSERIVAGNVSHLSSYRLLRVAALDSSTVTS